MAPDINNPGGVKNDPDEIRDGVVSDSTRFPGGFIDQAVSSAGAAVQIVGQFQVTNSSFFQSFDVSAQTGRPVGLTFKPDGTQLYVADRSTDNVYQYSLSTAFDVFTASFVRSFDVGSQDSRPVGIAFKPDGTQLYITGRINANVYQYSLSTAFDISTASFVRSFDVSGQDSSPRGLAFRPDGSEMYIIGNDDQNVDQFSLSTTFDISSASFVRSFDVSSQDGNPEGLALTPDGSQVYVIGGNNQSIFQYDLGTAFDISSASFDQSLDVSSQDTSPKGVTFNPDGSQLYLTGRINQNVYQYTVGIIGAEF